MKFYFSEFRENLVSLRDEVYTQSELRLMNDRRLILKRVQYFELLSTIELAKSFKTLLWLFFPLSLFL